MFYEVMSPLRAAKRAFRTRTIWLVTIESIVSAKANWCMSKSSWTVHNHLTQTVK